MMSVGEVLGASLEVRAVAVAVTESPIEAAMLVGLIGRIPYIRTEVHLSGRGIEPGVYGAFFVTQGPATVAIVPQLKIRYEEHYRLDFGVILERDGHQICAAIECDGQEFHSNPEDVKRDKERDRNLTVAGWLVMRFPGQQIVSGVSTGGDLAWKTLLSLLRVWSSDPQRVEVGIPEPVPVPAGGST